MRIVAGKYGGRRLETPKDRSIRPTSDKVRGAIFNALQSRKSLEGAYVCDGFCGSGALGLEALSRGAEHCLFIDIAPASIALAKANAKGLDVMDHCTFKKLNLGGSFSMQMNQKIDVLFLDAPYNKSLLSPALSSFLTHSLLAGDSFVILESEVGHKGDYGDAFEPVLLKSYGDTQVEILRYAA